MILLAALAWAGDLDVRIGSYGRADAATRLDGQGGETVTVVSHPGRLHADPYLELDLAWDFEADDGARFRSLVTPALTGDLFHYTGEFDAALAVRNLYVEADRFGLGGVSVWAGSRMYRGDDVYLLDFWPLDSLNTVGGGIAWGDERTAVSAHVGVNRLADGDWQYQQVAEPLPGGVASEWVTVLDRQRLIASLKGSRELPVGKVVLRPKLSMEMHAMPEGEREVEDPAVTQALPAERGGVLGGQLSMWGQAAPFYVHLFYRHATGIAATGELFVPEDGLADDRSVGAAREDLAALAANWDAGPVSLAAGAYVRSFVDADGEAVDVDDYWETVVALRPTVYPTEHVALQVEASREWRRPNGLNPRTDAFDRPSITRLSFVPAVQPRRGTFARPQVHLRYSAILLDQDARDWFNPDDVRVDGPALHEVGIGAEWWLNSVSYR